MTINNRVFAGMPTPTSIINAASTSGYTGQDVSFLGQSAKKIESGALTASTYKEIDAHTSGSGVIEFLLVGQNDAVARSIGARITLDGKQYVFDAVNPMPADADYGYIIVGTGGRVSTTALSESNGFVPYKTDYKLEISSSITETDKAFIKVNRHETS